MKTNSINNKQTFSIIIPTYNRADKLEIALDSVNKSTCRDFEVIVADDGSTDHTKKVVDRFADEFRLTYLWEQNWGGPARPRNNAINIAKGEYIAFLDADDWWYPNKLDIVKRYLSDADVIHHDLDIFLGDKRKLFKKVKGRHLKKPVFIDLMRNENALITSGVVVRKDLIAQVGGFIEDKRLVSLEDFDLWLKLSRATEKFCYIPKSLGAYLIDDENISKAAESKIKKLELLYDIHMKFLEEKNKQQANKMMHYLIGRTRQKNGMYDEALASFQVAAKSENLKINIRAKIWLILIRLFYKRLNKIEK